MKKESLIKIICGGIATLVLATSGVVLGKKIKNKKVQYSEEVTENK